MLECLITSKMRVQILMRLFMDPTQHAYLRELAHDFHASPGHVRSELQQLASAGLLSSNRVGRQILYQADTSHPLFPELQSMVRKALGMDRIVDSIIERLGALDAAYVTGDYACGRDSGIVDLVLVGRVNQECLTDLATKTERYIKRKIRVLALTGKEYVKLQDTLNQHPILLLWQRKASRPSDGPVGAGRRS